MQSYLIVVIYSYLYIMYIYIYASLPWTSSTGKWIVPAAGVPITVPPGITVGTSCTMPWSTGYVIFRMPRFAWASSPQVVPRLPVGSLWGPCDGNGLWDFMCGKNWKKPNKNIQQHPKTWNKHKQTHLCKALQSYTPFQAALRMSFFAPLPLKERNYISRSNYGVRLKIYGQKE